MHSINALVLGALFICIPLVRAVYKWNTGEIRLTNFKTKYANSKADIFFLIDNSGSLYDWETRRNGFYDEKAFVSALLDEIKIAKLATRVAIIRFSTWATVDINYVTNLNGLNNKCEFVKEFANVRFTNGMTNMNDAFAKVNRILLGEDNANVRPWRNSGPNSASNVNKVVFLLTDGGWNDGGDPRDKIQNLKDTDVEIFTVGVGAAVKDFLKKTASSTDRYFYYNNFKDFRDLATHIRGDPYHKDYEAQAVPTSRCKTKCDDNASCGCGLRSGKYICICHAGFYGDGSVGKCKACEPGTYKDFIGLSATSCTRCPLHSGHTKTGSRTIKDCRCDNGYEGDPTTGKNCSIKICNELLVPKEGYTNPSTCVRKYGSSCEFQCNQGFELSGDKTLKCTVKDNNFGGAYWAGKQVTHACERIVCKAYLVDNAMQRTGHCTFSDRRLGTICTYSCVQGYRLSGSSKTTCQADRTWSGTNPKCEVVTCPPLNSLTLAKISERECVEKPVRFDTVCRFTCPPGYASNSSRVQTFSRVCGTDGKWSGSYEVCKDIMAPKFTNCPKNIFTYNVTKHLNTAEVSWPEPLYEDNSQIYDVNSKVTLTEANNYTSPHIFYIGKHNIKYIVTDKDGYQADCQFTIVIEDNEAPYYTLCPPDVLKETTKDKVKVIWDEPIFLDNSGKNPIITANHRNSIFFRVGTTFQVYYTARDDSGNENSECTFQVIVKKIKCGLYPIPKNGAVLCTAPSGSDDCTPYCREGYDFGYKPAILYYCRGGQWFTWPPVGKRQGISWPDCALRGDPKNATLKMASSFYFSGSCRDKEVRLELKKRFINALNDTGVFSPTFCRFFVLTCNIGNVQVYCGKTTAPRQRRRRGLQMEIHISADYVVAPNSGLSQAKFQELKKNMNKQLLNNARNKAQNINWKSSMKLDEVKKPTIKESEPYCSGTRGAVIGRCEHLQHNCKSNNFANCLCNGENGRIEKCIECPIGKFYDVMTRRCEICKDGTFQDEEGQFGCKPCLPGTSTFGDDAKNFTSCKDICQPGYYSATGLSPCHACPFGQYSTDTWSKSCTKCPSGTITVLAASTKIEDCGMKCAPGTSSSNGVEPCEPCAKGFYQPKEGELACLPCERIKSTYGPGAKTISHCIEINDCDSNPCNNDATCKDLKDSYECICKAGFTGRNCEKEVSECLSNPCYDNAVCADKIFHTDKSKNTKRNINKDKPTCSSKVKPPGCPAFRAPRNGALACITMDDHDLEMCMPLCKYGFDFNYMSADFYYKTGGLWMTWPHWVRFKIPWPDCTVRGFPKGSSSAYFSGDCNDVEVQQSLKRKLLSYLKNPMEVPPSFCILYQECTLSNARLHCGETLSQRRKLDETLGYRCVCAKGFTGANCDELLPQCPGSTCQNGAKCVEMAGTYSCECRDAFTGRFCEINTDDCASKPCKNGGICRDGVDTFKCECRSGFMGDQCEINRDECASDPCQNGGTCVDKLDGYICQCVSGYVGRNCEVDDNECAPNPCKNRGKCVNQLGGFQCTCAPTFSGRTCETEHSSDFDLSFPTYEIRSYSKARLREDLHAFTLSFWMRTRDLDNVGTPVSYSVKRGNYVEENGIVLKDYGNLAIQINNQTGYTSDPLNDGKWHHVAITWASSNGIWVYYRDGKEIKRASEPLAKGDHVRGGGQLVLAQEQDWDAVEGAFTYNPLEAFLGDMSQLNLWNKVLSDREIYNLAGSCNSAEGDAIVVAWGDFVSELQGMYKKTEKSHACDFSSSLRHFDAIYKAHLPSNDHKTLTSVSAEDCAKACEKETTFACRSFDYNSAARKCFLSQAYRETVSILSSNNDVYDYYELSCLDTMGMESGFIRDSQLSASSARNSLSGAKEARRNRLKVQNVAGVPNSEGGWIPSSFNQNQYLQIDLGKTMKVTGVETQGADGHSYWVKSYKLQHSVNGHIWTTLPQAFSGNSDNKGIKKHEVNMKARYIRLLPKSWSSGIGMRLEIYGCSLDPEGVPKDLATIKSSHGGSCNPNPCRNGGSCNSLAYGYACKCKPGYTGKICETALSCDDPGTPTNGYKSSSKYNDGSSVTFGCHSGYSLSGSSRRTCKNGQWTASKAACLNINECSLGLCNQHCTDFPGSYRCSCVAGYRLASNKQTCQDINECQEKVCSHGCVNTPGSFRCTCPSGLILGSSGTKCEDKDECSSRNGYCDQKCLNTFRSNVCHCKGGYALSSDGKSCQEVRCPNAVRPQNGKLVINGDPILGNSAKYSCTDGFKLVGSDQRICQANGQWSGNQPSCQAVKCVEVGNVDHASRQGNDRGYNSRVVFTCQSSYRLLGTAVRTCQKTGTWSNEQPFCVAQYCPALKAPVHGRINGYRTQLGATVGVSCDIGYKVIGTSFRTCESSRKWSGSDPTCTLVDCGDPGIPLNGYRHGNYFKYNSTINFSCKSRHHLEGKNVIICKTNGKWSAPKPDCLARSCGNPGVPFNGFKHGASHTYGSTVYYTCQKGYTLLGDRQRYCEEATAKWTGSLPLCQLVSCGAQAVPDNGFRVGAKVTYNEILRFDCNPGYKLVGSNSRRCQANGVWSGLAPSCLKSSCGSSLRGPAGVIESPNFPNDYGDNIYCTWKVDVPKGKKVRIEFKSFKTEKSKDFLYIFDTGKTDPIIEFSGVSYIPLPLTSSGNSIRIRFVSNGATSSNGFQLHYSQVDCGGMLATPTGVVESPNYKGQYPLNADCSWLIHIPLKAIELKFTDFNTQRSYDRVTIYHGPYSNIERVADYSGVGLPYEPVLTSNYMYIRFTTSKRRSRAYHGFSAYYKGHLYRYNGKK